MLDENTVPPGLWSLILERCPRWDRPRHWWPIHDTHARKERCDFSVALTLRPHLVKGKVESSIDAGTEKSVDGPVPKRKKIN